MLRSATQDPDRHTASQVFTRMGFLHTRFPPRSTPNATAGGWAFALVPLLRRSGASAGAAGGASKLRAEISRMRFADVVTGCGAKDLIAVYASV
jgi:hypothetical protein